MGFLGKVLGTTATVTGRVAVVNRPPGTHFILTTCFLPCAAGAGPIHEGLPPDERWKNWNAARPEGDAADPGEAFSIELGSGHYQVCVLATPFIIEGGKMVYDPTRRTGHWPLPKALEIQGGKARTLSLKVKFEAGLQAFGDQPANRPPLAERVGPIWMGMLDRARKAEAQGAVAALKEYDALLARPQLAQLPRGDLLELRFIAQGARTRLLASLGKDAEALEAFSRILPDYGQSEQMGPTTRWSVSTAMAVVIAWKGDPDRETPATVAGSLNYLQPLFDARGAAAAEADLLAAETVRSVGQALSRRRLHLLIFDVLSAAEGVLQPRGLAAVHAMVTINLVGIETLVQLGQREQAVGRTMVVINNGDAGIVALHARLAGTHQLKGAAALFEEFAPTRPVSTAWSAETIGPPKPFVERIGPALAEGYAHAAALGNAGKPAEALAAYDALLARRELASLPALDGLEFRMVMENGRAKCLLSLRQTDQAIARLSAVIKASSQREYEGLDPVTRFDLFVILAVALVQKGDGQAAAKSLSFGANSLGRFLAEGGERSQRAQYLIAFALREVLKPCHAAGAWAAGLLVIDGVLAVVNAPGTQETEALQTTCFLHSVETLLGMGARDRAGDLATTTLLDGSRGTWKQVAQLARDEGLERTAAFVQQLASRS